MLPFWPSFVSKESYLAPPHSLMWNFYSLYCVKSLNLLTCLLSASRGDSFPSIIMLQVLGVPSSALYGSIYYSGLVFECSSRSFFLFSCRTAELCCLSVTHSTLVQVGCWDREHIQHPPGHTAQVHILILKWLPKQCSPMPLLCDLGRHLSDPSQRGTFAIYSARWCWIHNPLDCTYICKQHAGHKHCTHGRHQEHRAKGWCTTLSTRLVFVSRNFTPCSFGVYLGENW